MNRELTIEMVQKVLDQMYKEGKVSKCMVDGEEAYSLIDSPNKKPVVSPFPEKPKIEFGDSYNLLQRLDPPIPYPCMKWRSKVYEITGIKDGGRIVSKFFALDQKNKAVEYLKTMEKGHVWLSEATDSVDCDYGLFTGKRKRVHLLSPDAISH